MPFSNVFRKHFDFSDISRETYVHTYQAHIVSCCIVLLRVTVHCGLSFSHSLIFTNLKKHSAQLMWLSASKHDFVSTVFFWLLRLSNFSWNAKICTCPEEAHSKSISWRLRWKFVFYFSKFELWNVHSKNWVFAPFQIFKVEQHFNAFSLSFIICIRLFLNLAEMNTGYIFNSYAGILSASERLSVEMQIGSWLWVLTSISR